MEQVENRMVVDSEWEFLESQKVETSLTEKGYHNYKTNEFVTDDEAYEYALDNCLNGLETDKKEFREMLVEWYFSGGDWRREKG